MQGLVSVATLIVMVALATTVLVHPKGVAAFFKGLATLFNGALSAAQGK
jgi:hypothetical protein